MNIKISKKQFKSLLELVYLGNWVANADNDPECLDKKYEKVTDLIYSHGTEADLDKYVVYSEDSQSWTPSEYLHMKSTAKKLLKEYNKHNFWTELTHNFGLRDFRNKYSAEKVKKMSRIKRAEKFFKLMDEYVEETNEHGIERFTIIKSIPHGK